MMGDWENKKIYMPHRIDIAKWLTSNRSYKTNKERKTDEAMKVVHVMTSFNIPTKL